MPANHPLVTSASSVPFNSVEAGVKTSIQVLIPPDRAPNFAMRCFTIEPGGGMPNHTNMVEHEQYVLQGAAEVGVGDEIHQVGKGDVVFIPANMPHWYKALGDEPFQFLCLVPNQPDKIRIVGTE
ncbi:MAG TPA: cupin domain-containing protein [Geothermobacteraceae bacterium]|nr:cupin domain-containing protein [Geothermobacteraceae bacterium]